MCVNSNDLLLTCTVHISVYAVVFIVLHIVLHIDSVNQWNLSTVSAPIVWHSSSQNRHA